MTWCKAWCCLETFNSAFGAKVHYGMEHEGESAGEKIAQNDERNAKIAEAQTGESNSFYGQKLTDEHKQALGEGKLDTRSDAFKRNMRERMSGSNNPMWKGGCGVDRGGNWNEISQRIRERDNYTCQWCRMRPPVVSLVVHHIVPARIQLDNSPSNLITLCRSCHPRAESGDIEFK